MRRPDALLDHLRHAEEWLARARRDHRRGDHRAAVLRLMLAEAEIRHARETAMRRAVDPFAPRARRVPAAARALGAAAAVVAVGYAAFLGVGATAPATPPAARVAAAVSAPEDVIRLDSGGALTLTPFPPREVSVGGAARTFGDRVVDDVVLRSRWLAPASGEAATLLSPPDAGRPAGTF